MKLPKLILTVLLSSVALFSPAQDLIYKKNREILRTKITEVTEDEIKFKDYDNPDGPLFTIGKHKVSKVELENGEELKMDMNSNNSFNDPDYYTGQSKNAIKVSFSGFLADQAAFFYERSLTPSSSVEAGITFIGAGFDPYENDSKGVGLRIGYKLKRSPDFYLAKMRYGHLLKGGYIKPEIILSAWNYPTYQYFHSTGDFKSGNSSTVSGAFMLTMGKQNVFDDLFLIDYYWGIGFGFSEDGGVNYGFTGGGDFPLAFSMGINIGMVFKDKKDRE